MKSISRIGLAIILILGVAAPHAGAAPVSLLLADEGRARLPIVISTQASQATQKVAAELAEYLGRITGAKFAVETGDGSTGIVLGTLAQFPNPALNPALAIRKVYDGKEAFAIRTEARRLLLIGATDLGAEHAAYRFLEMLGCRWFFPAPEWEVIPRQKKLVVALDGSERPRFLSRRIWYGWGCFVDKGHPRGGSAQADYDAWARHNLMASSFEVSAGHAWQTIIRDNQRVFAEHPEYLALVKGKRQGPQLCVSNAALRQLAVSWALAQLQKNPQSDMVSMECSDGDSQCECEECRRLGSVSDRAFGLGNEVAKAVGRTYPGKMVGMLSYNQHSEPPSFELEPNLHVQMATAYIRGRYNLEERLDLWPTKCKNLGIRDYYSVWPWDFDRLPGGAAADITKLQTAIRRHAKAGATSLSAESGNNWGVHGRGYYVANRLMWNPEADVNALLTDFYGKAFGPAAPAMKRYYERVAPDSQHLLNRGLVGEAFRDVAEATNAARNRPDVLARLDQIKHYLRYVHLRWLIDHTPDKVAQKPLALAAFTLTYQTRYEYMNHWEAIRRAWIVDAAKTYEQPTWAKAAVNTGPWAVDRPLNQAETDARFQEGLKYFQPTLVKEIKFSDDLIPVRFPVNRPNVSLQKFQQPATYALHSTSGEALEVEITAGIIPSYRDLPDARYSLRDRAGNMVAQGRLKLDNRPQKLSLRPPGPGTYMFECTEMGAGWQIRVAPDRAAVLLPDRGRAYKHLGRIQEMFFYVPRGTKEVAYHWSGGEHRVLSPGGKILAEVTASDEVVSVPVPPGMDGQCWSLTPHVHGHLWFYNVPNCLAASPNALLLPREVVARDGLSARR